MRISEGVEWSVHCCTVLAVLPSGTALPAARLAEYHDVPAAYLAKHLQALSAAGIVESVRGPRGGYRLARPAEEVTVLDVVRAVEGDEPAFRCTEIRQQGPAGGPPEWYPRPCGIARTMWDAEQAWRQVLAERTIAQLVAGVMADARPEAVESAVSWFQGVIR
jgi:Rrf2 family protein